MHHVTAVDISAPRLRRVKDNLDRLHLRPNAVTADILTTGNRRRRSMQSCSMRLALQLVQSAAIPTFCMFANRAALKSSSSSRAGCSIAHQTLVVPEA